MLDVFMGALSLTMLLCFGTLTYATVKEYKQRDRSQQQNNNS